MAELGLSEHHQNEVIQYMRFARSKRLLRLKTVDSCVQDLKESRLVDDTFTAEEVADMLEGLRVVVRGELESELIHTAHTNVLLLRQLFSQAEHWHLKLQADVSELENRELLEQIAELEKSEFIAAGKKPSTEVSKAKLAPLSDVGATELLNKEIQRLREENEKLKVRIKMVETQATSALEERSRLERSLKEASLHPPADQRSPPATDLSALEQQVSALRADLQREQSAGATGAAALQEGLAASQHELLRIKQQLEVAEKELDSKFQDTVAYRNLKDMLARKNDSIKDLRKRLSRYEPED
ncbi:leucine zipper transcription factor-like protein 1 [Petromyzon marinus]|uniref:Leucine zipper transcription factor-like protein 1 n=2 Tax=Petromyzon marinus TaxID=7757 RepID=A0AAJ7U9Z0_PETMA|nr:leucine zipper transcription factor-like protein 1 isoform X1 [Petromyzon marinus]